MTKKMFDNAKVHSTVTKQDVALEDRFEKADSILLKNSAAAQNALVPLTKTTVVRDTFSMPQDDYARIEALRLVAAKSGRVSTSKSEVIRAGLQVLSALNAQQLLEALSHLEKLVPGRKAN